MYPESQTQLPLPHAKVGHAGLSGLAQYGWQGKSQVVLCSCRGQALDDKTWTLQTFFESLFKKSNKDNDNSPAATLKNKRIFMVFFIFASILSER